VGGLTDAFEGEHRPGHFAGVATVVTKMLNMVGPDAAFFGAKDAQQVAVVRRLVRDLDLPVAIEVVPTVREPDGLAMSSRNVHLRGRDRERATALHRALEAARAAVDGGERDPVRIRTAAEDALRTEGITPEYVAVVDPDSFQPVAAVNGHVLVALAARVGPTRLIDNAVLQTEV
jgi:pantoate--beta-alanine ligase